MNKSEKILCAIGQIDDELLVDALCDILPDTETAREAASSTPQSIKPDTLHRSGIAWVAIAACLCLLVFGALYGVEKSDIFSLLSIKMPETEGNTDSILSNQQSGNAFAIPDNSDFVDPHYASSGTESSGIADVPDRLLASSVPTSDTYKTLEELLSYLSSHDYHDTESDRSQSVNPDFTVENQSATEGCNVVVCSGYAYHLGADRIYISRLANGTSENAGSISFPQELSSPQLFGHGKRLILTGSFVSNIGEVSPDGQLSQEYSMETNTCVRLYNLSNPESPELTHVYRSHLKR